MATTAATITSYDTGNKPFKSDISRGKWSSLRDFYAAVFTHSFGIKTFSSLPIYAVSQCGILFMVPFLLGLFLLTIPINFIQSFMGQFSSSGFISVYRIAPLFKGVGYVLLIINLVSICCNVGIGSHALVYFFASFNPEIPWMNCNNEWNSHNCTVEQKFEANHTQEYFEIWSTIEYFVYAVHQEQIDVESSTLTLSWRLMFCLTIMWIVTTAAVIQGVEFIGKLLRYFCYIIFVCFFLISLRITLIEKSYHILWNFFVPDIGKFHITHFILNLVLPIILIGSGGGTLLTMSSYNNFHSDIRLYSWINAIILMNVLIISGITSNIAEEYLLENFHFKSFYHGLSDVYFPFIDLSFLFGHFELPNFWSILFFLMLFLGELSGCIIQMLTIVTAIFDEYELLRTYKEGITIVLSVLLFLLSIPFATNVGSDLIEHLFNASAITLCLLCFLDIMIVVWIYGRQRFQRDVQFLLQGKMYKTWEFMILRFVTPVLTLFVLLLNVLIFTSEFLTFETSWETLIITISVKILPLTLILIWIIYKLKISTGSNILKRFKNLCIPTDWYPVDPGDKRRYEDVIGACSENFRDLFTNIHIEDIECEDDGD